MLIKFKFAFVTVLLRPTRVSYLLSFEEPRFLAVTYFVSRSGADVSYNNISR